MRPLTFSLNLAFAATFLVAACTSARSDQLLDGGAGGMGGTGGAGGGASSTAGFSGTGNSAGSTAGSGGVGGGGGMSVVACSSTQHDCSGTCPDNTSIQSCGT